MPHVPKQPLGSPRLASTTSPIPLEIARSRCDDAVPPAAGQQPKQRPGVIRVRPPTISVRNYRVDTDKVIAQLFGRELKFNEVTGVCDLYEPSNPRNLVPASIPNPAVPR